jgi:hypothetical protein
VPAPAASAAASAARSPPRAAEAPTWRRENLSVEDLVTDRAKVGTLVTVDVVEPLLSSGQSSAAEPGQYDVESDALEGTDLLLSPARSEAERAGGVLRELPAKLSSPVRITAQVVRERRKNPVRDDEQVVLLVHAVTPLLLPAPEPLPSPKVGPITTGFETSDFGHGVWFHALPDADLRCADGAGDARVTGFAHTRLGHYGHMGAARAQIDATQVENVAPSKPGCR